MLLRRQSLYMSLEADDPQLPGVPLAVLNFLALRSELYFIG